MAADRDVEARRVLLETFRRAWGDDADRPRLGAHEMEDAAVHFVLVSPFRDTAESSAVVTFSWSQIEEAVASESSCRALRDGIAAVWPLHTAPRPSSPDDGPSAPFPPKRLH